MPAKQPEFSGSHLGVREARRASEINVSDPPKLDEETLARIRSIHRDYFERWTLLPVGGTLDLRFYSPARNSSSSWFTCSGRSCCTQ